MKIMNKSTRKILSFMLLFLTVSASWTGAKAEIWGVPIGDYYYRLDDSNHTGAITNKKMSTTIQISNSYSGNVKIPSSVTYEGESYTITRIENNAFYKCTSLESITIPKTIKEIGLMAFEGCSQLKTISVEIENTSFSATDNILYDKGQSTVLLCAAQKEGICTLPKTVVKIANSAFSGCTKITKVILPDNLNTIESYAFYECSSLASINLPNALTSIGTYAFYNATSLASDITIPNGITEIKDYTFYGCSKIKNVTLHDAITSIGTYAFSRCTSLTSISLPNYLTEIKTYAFSESALTSIVIPTDIKEIPKGVFENCKLTSITLPEGLETIGLFAFRNNGKDIQTVNIPKSVKKIANNAFDGTFVKNFYIRNIPSKIEIAASTPFDNTKNFKIHVFSKLKTAFENAENWSEYKNYIVDDIDIVHVNKINLDKTSIIAPYEQEVEITAILSPENCEISDVVFTTSDPAIIKVDNASEGRFTTGQKDGEAIITCTALDGSGMFATCKVKVVNNTVLATNIIVSNMPSKMSVGQQIHLGSKILPDNATHKTILWGSTNTSVATITADGTITAVGSGITFITATSLDNNVREEFELAVSYGSQHIYADAETINDVKVYTNYTRSEDIAVEELTYTRTYKNSYWQPTYLPFEMSYDDWKDNFEVAVVNNIHQFDYDDNGTIDETLIEVVKLKDGKTLKAHTPCVMKAKNPSATPQDIVVHDVILRKAENKFIDCASVYTKYVFYGTYNTMDGAELVAGNYWAMAGKGVRAAKSSDLLGPYRWYLDIVDREAERQESESKHRHYDFSDAKITIVCLEDDEIDNETNGIETEEGNDIEKIVAIYDVNGRKQNEFTKGINIVKYSNGSTKKIIK